MKEYVPIFFDWLETTQDLTAEEKGNLIDAVVAYAAGQEYEHLLSGGCRIAFRFLKGQIDRNSAISESRSRAGANKKEQTETNDNKTEQTLTNVIKIEQTETNYPKENNNKNKKEKEKENDIKENLLTEVKEKFARFWAAYPRHEAKAVALKAFEKLKPDEDLLRTMLVAIERQKATRQWQENGGSFIPHPATWLNQHRWEDECKTESAVKAQGYEQRDYTSAQDEAMQIMLRRLQEGPG